MADERSRNQLTMPPVDAEHASTFTPGAAHFGTPVMAQPGQMIVVSKESSTPKVVGIITIIYGSLSLLTFLIQTAVFSAVPSVRQKEPPKQASEAQAIGSACSVRPQVWSCSSSEGIGSVNGNGVASSSQ